MMNFKSNSDCAKIVKALKRYKNGATADRLVERTGIDRASLSSFLSKLVRLGLLQKAENTRLSRAGRQVAVYQIVPNDPGCAVAA